MTESEHEMTLSAVEKLAGHSFHFQEFERSKADAQINE
jgi:hypothetical protein